jgi:hypothetical protein
MLQQFLRAQDRLLNILHEKIHIHMQTQLNALRAELQPGNRASLSVPPEHIVSQYRPPLIQNRCTLSLMNPEPLHTLPRADCPGFNGINPIEWLRKCNSFFDMHLVPTAYRTHLATMQFHDSANE